MHFWSIKGVYFFQNANNLNVTLFLDAPASNLDKIQTKVFFSEENAALVRHCFYFFSLFGFINGIYLNKDLSVLRPDRFFDLGLLNVTVAAKTA